MSASVESFEIAGDCDQHFTAVREAFTANFVAGREVGASFAAFVDGRPVVDLWGGFADAARERRWQRDTIVNVFSTTKAMTVLVMHMLIDRGVVDVDDTVASVWPEFAQAGKGMVTLRHVLSHTAGLPTLREPIPLEALYDWERMTAALAAEALWWEPGTANGYHALTIGYLLGEVVRRLTGKSVGTLFREEIAEPLGADFAIGLPESEDPRVADMVPSMVEEAGTGPAAGLAAPGSIGERTFSNPPLRGSDANTVGWRRAEIPAGNGHGNARSVARVLSIAACGGEVAGRRFLREQTIAHAIEEQRYAKDLVLGFRMRWGLGFMLTSRQLPLGPNPRTFGHGGWGGSLGFADLDARVSWAYVMNKMSPGTTGDDRVAAILASLYGALA